MFILFAFRILIQLEITINLKIIIIISNSVILKKKNIFIRYHLRYIHKVLNKNLLWNFNDYSHQIVNTVQLVVFIIITKCNSRKRFRYSSIYLVLCQMFPAILSSLFWSFQQCLDVFQRYYTDIPVLAHINYSIYKETIFWSIILDLP